MRFFFTQIWLTNLGEEELPCKYFLKKIPLEEIKG